MKNLNDFKKERLVWYLVVGGVNALSSYLISLGLYYSLSPSLHIVVIGILANILCITFSFLTYKILVFRTKGNWIREYARCYVVYGGSALLGIGGIWLLIDGLQIPFWLAQGGLMIVITIFSYLGHSRFSFVSARSDSASNSRRGARTCPLLFDAKDSNELLPGISHLRCSKTLTQENILPDPLTEERNDA